MKKFLKWFLHLVICRFGIHDYEITKWSRYKDKKRRHLEEEGHSRECKQCGKRQYLGKPKKYHPSAYVWLNSNGIQWLDKKRFNAFYAVLCVLRIIKRMT